MGKKNVSAPAPDPAIGQAIQGQLQLSRETLDFWKQTYEENKPRQQAMDDLNLKIGSSLLEDSATNRQRSQEQYEFYQQHGRPVQQAFLQDALAAGSEAERSQMRGRAASDVEQAFAGARQQNMRTMSRYGIVPNAERMATLSQGLAAQAAAAKAGAITNADLAERQRGDQMRAAGANVAGGMPATSMAFGNQAGQQGGQAFGMQGAANQSAMGFQNQMGQGFGQAGGMMNSAGQLANSAYGNQLQGWQAAQQASSQSASGFGSMLGMGASMLMMSSKKAKEGNSPVDDEAALEGLRRAKVQSWRYKGGDGRRQVGPMAEDMQAAFGDTVAPGGQAIDVVSTLGVHHSAVRALADRLDRLEGGRRAAMADGGYVHEAARQIGGRERQVNDAVDRMSRGEAPRQADDKRMPEKSAGEQVRERTKEAVGGAFDRVRKAVGLADGGPAGVRDDIPAMLSKGEFVIPADVVRAKGTEFFDKLVQRHHTPAAVQRKRAMA
jgi:hypothetical protein